ncbi:MAG TPA: hypothetical protein VIZ18_09465 [Ktedonobacteraceae bacterium]
MQANLHDYDKRASWMPPQNQPYTGRFVTSQDGRPQYAPQAQPQHPAQIQRPMDQKPKAPQKMPRERAMALAYRFKRAFAIASIVGFGTLSGLVALHQVSSTATQSNQSSSGSSSSNSSNSSNSTNSSSQSSNGFFNQQGGNTGGTSSSSSSSSSSTVSGTHTS